MYNDKPLWIGTVNGQRLHYEPQWAELPYVDNEELDTLGLLEGRQHGWDSFKGLERIEHTLKWRSRRLPRTRSGRSLYFLGGYKMCYAVTIV